MPEYEFGIAKAHSIIVSPRLSAEPDQKSNNNSQITLEGMRYVRGTGKDISIS